jgi:hypothetical protein
VTLEEVHKLLAAWKVPRLSPQFHVYELRRKLWPPLVRTIRLHRQQAELLRAVRALGWKVFLAYDENPAEWVNGKWSRVGDDTWLVPPEEASERLLDGYLAPGSWTIYLAQTPIGQVQMPYMFQRSPKEVCEFLRSHGMPVMLQAHADNSEWIVALEPAVVFMARAA